MEVMEQSIHRYFNDIHYFIQSVLYTCFIWFRTTVISGNIELIHIKFTHRNIKSFVCENLEA
jgi:hypothetical protein